jgi:serine/threonine protein kinase
MSAASLLWNCDVWTPHALYEYVRDLEVGTQLSILCWDCSTPDGDSNPDFDCNEWVGVVTRGATRESPCALVHFRGFAEPTEFPDEQLRFFAVLNIVARVNARRITATPPRPLVPMLIPTCSVAKVWTKVGSLNAVCCCRRLSKPICHFSLSGECTTLALTRHPASEHRATPPQKAFRVGLAVVREVVRPHLVSVAFVCFADVPRLYDDGDWVTAARFPLGPGGAQEELPSVTPAEVRPFSTHDDEGVESEPSTATDGFGGLAHTWAGRARFLSHLRAESPRAPPGGFVSGSLVILDLGGSTSRAVSIRAAVASIIPRPISAAAPRSVVVGRVVGIAHDTVVVVPEMPELAGPKLYVAHPRSAHFVGVRIPGVDDAHAFLLQLASSVQEDCSNYRLWNRMRRLLVTCTLRPLPPCSEGGWWTELQAVNFLEPVVFGPAKPATASGGFVFELKPFVKTRPARPTMRGSAMRGAAARLNGGVSKNVVDVPLDDSWTHLEPTMNATADGEDLGSRRTGQGWMATGQNPALYFHPALDIEITVHRESNDPDANPAPLNAVPPLLFGGCAVHIALRAAFKVSFANVVVDMVDEDGDPLPAGIVRAVEELSGPCTGSSEEEERWQPLDQFPTFADDVSTFARPVQQFAVTLLDFPAEHDKLIARLRIFVLEAEEADEPIGDDDVQLVPPAALAQAAKREGPLCAIVSRPIILRSTGTVASPVTTGAEAETSIVPSAFPRRTDLPTTRGEGAKEVDEDDVKILCPPQRKKHCTEAIDVDGDNARGKQPDDVVADCVASPDMLSPVATEPAVVGSEADASSYADAEDKNASFETQIPRPATETDISPAREARVTKEAQKIDKPAAAQARARLAAKKEFGEASASYVFWSQDLLGPDCIILNEVFVDPGRSNVLHTVNPVLADPADEPANCLYPANRRGIDRRSSFLSDASEVDPEDERWLSTASPRYTSAYDGMATPDREVLVVDWARDARLRCIVDGARRVVHSTMDVHARAQALSWYVAGVLGGPSIDGSSAEDSLFELRKAINSHRCVRDDAHTSKTRRVQRNGNAAAARRLGATQRGSPQSIVSLSSVRVGLCRHRALLFKLLCDEARVPCYLMRGDYDHNGFPNGCSSNESARHTWNVVLAQGQSWLVDATLSAFTPLRPWPHPFYSGPALPVVKFALVHDLCVLGATKLTTVEEIGSGVSAVVRRCTIGGLTCAVKLPRDDEDFALVRREYELLESLPDCKHIVQVLGWRRGIVMEFMPHSLLSFMNHLTLRGRRISRKQRVDIITGVVTALHALHSMRRVHRDVKAENVLIAANRCAACKPLGVYCEQCSVLTKLTDFADATELPPHTEVHSGTPAVGTMPYAAPEIEAEAPFSYAADMWAVGILATELRLMELPTAAHGSEATYNMPLLDGGAGGGTVLLKANVPRCDESHRGLALVMRGCLNLDWRVRPSAAEALRIISDTGSSNGKPRREGHA